MKYIRQTGRSFLTRYREHFWDYKYGNGNSKCAQHLLDNKHSISPIHETMNILHTIKKGKMMDTIGKFCIYIETKLGHQINDKNIITQNILFDTFVQKISDSRLLPTYTSLPLVCCEPDIDRPTGLLKTTENTPITVSYYILFYTYTHILDSSRYFASSSYSRNLFISTHTHVLRNSPFNLYIHHYRLTWLNTSTAITSCYNYTLTTLHPSTSKPRTKTSHKN